MYSPNLTIAKVRDAHLFNKSRTRLQRSRDMKAYCGWMLDFAVGSASIRMKGAHHDIRLGDQFSVEVTGKEKTAVFIAQTYSKLDGTFEMLVPRGVVTLPKKNDARVLMFGFQGHLRFEGEKIPFTLSDISENGMGLLVGAELPADGEIEFEVTTPQGILGGRGEIRYAQPDPHQPERYAIGVKIDHADRISQARWQRVLTSVWEQ